MHALVTRAGWVIGGVVAVTAGVLLFSAADIRDAVAPSRTDGVDGAGNIQDEAAPLLDV